MIKHGSPPLINALSTLLLVVTFATVWLSQRLTKENRMKNAPPSPRPAPLVVALGCAAGCRSRSPTGACTSTPGPTTSSPSWCSASRQENNCKVVIDTFDSNEAMYAKLKAGATGYDLITP